MRLGGRRWWAWLFGGLAIGNWFGLTPYFGFMHLLDVAIVGFYLLVMLLVGVYFSRQQRTSKDFFLAGRSMGWQPVGLSILATLLSAYSFARVPSEAYYAGWQLLLLPAAAWLTLPIMTAWILPLYHRLEIFSIYEYLELRFDAATRRAASTAFLVWRLAWLAGLLYFPCKVLNLGGQGSLLLLAWILVLGLVATLYTYLGGLKAVLWTDVLQAWVMLAGVAVLIGCLWWSAGGPDRIREVAGSLGRTALTETQFSWTERWSVWTAAPHLFLTLLAFYVADQITAQRYLAAIDPDETRRAFALNCVAFTVMIAALAYVGLGLLTFYHEHPQAMRPNWVVNVDNATRGSITNPATRTRVLRDPQTGRPRLDLRTGEPMLDPTSGRPLIAWEEPITPDVLNTLLAEGRLLRPNTKEPFPPDAELTTVDPATGETTVDVLKLAMRSPPQGELQIGEIILHRDAQAELLPRFIATQLPWGAAGLVAAALLAAAMSSFDSGLTALGALLLADGYRRQGWGRKWLARKAKKPPEQLTEADELHLARPLTLVLGAAVTLLTLLASLVGDVLEIALAAVNILGGPLLGVFLLGIWTQRATGPGVRLALGSGVLLALWLTAANHYDALAWLWPFEPKLGPAWPLLIGVTWTLVAGYGASLVLGPRKTREALRGLVVGCGRLGVRHREPPQR